MFDCVCALDYVDSTTYVIHWWSSCFVAVAPTVAAESTYVSRIVGENVRLSFSVGEEANPCVYLENFSVTFNGTTVKSEGRFRLWLNNNRDTFRIRINSLTLADEEIYTVTVATTAGNDTAATMLEIYGEKNSSYMCKHAPAAFTDQKCED